jgi:hypothetical protein
VVLAEHSGWSLEDDGRVYLDPGDDLPAILAGHIEQGSDFAPPIEAWDYLASEWEDAKRFRVGCDLIPSRE